MSETESEYLVILTVPAEYAGGQTIDKAMVESALECMAAQMAIGAGLKGAARLRLASGHKIRDGDPELRKWEKTKEVRFASRGQDAINARAADRITLGDAVDELEVVGRFIAKQRPEEAKHAAMLVTKARKALRALRVLVEMEAAQVGERECPGCNGKGRRQRPGDPPEGCTMCEGTGRVD